MSAAGRWFRVNTTWSQSEWLAVLPPASRLAWIELLSHVKAHGYDGRVRAVAAAVFGRMVGIDAADVQALLDAAQADGALLLEGGEWVITGWMEHQGDPTAKTRMRRYREKQDVTDVTRNNRSVTPTETETKTEEPPLVPPDGGNGAGEDKPAEPKEEKRAQKRKLPHDWQPNAKHIQDAAERNVDLQLALAEFYDWIKSDAIRKADWDATFRNWLRHPRRQKLARSTNGNGRHLHVIIEHDPNEEAA